MFAVRNVGKTLVTRTQGTKVSTHTQTGGGNRAGSSAQGGQHVQPAGAAYSVGRRRAARGAALNTAAALAQPQEAQASPSKACSSSSSVGITLLRALLVATAAVAALLRAALQEKPATAGR